MLPILNMLEPGESPSGNIWWAGEAREGDSRALTVQILTETSREGRTVEGEAHTGRSSSARTLQR